MSLHRRVSSYVAVGTLLAACGGGSSSAPPPDPGPTGPSSPVIGTPVTVVEQSGGALQAVEWADLQSTPGCFYFSGPGELARDDRLGNAATWETTGELVALVFETLRFQGERRAQPLVLQRSSQHDYQGKWETTETFTLSPDGSGMLSGTYHYQECNMEDARDCPSRCRIDAQVRVPPPP